VPSADADEVEAAIVNDPLFLDEPTLVFAVPVLPRWKKPTIARCRFSRQAPIRCSICRRARCGESGAPQRKSNGCKHVFFEAINRSTK
jgi:hypothetical protein